VLSKPRPLSKAALRNKAEQLLGRGTVGVKVPGKIAVVPGLVGFWTLNGLAYVGGLATLAGRSAYLTFAGPLRGQRLRPHRALHQAMAVGVEAIPIVSLITFFVGLIIALQSAYELRKLGAMQFLASAVALSILRELGPLLTAIVVIGRSGSAFAAEIGTKKVTEEVDALKMMALDPVAFLVAPKFLAMLVMMPCLTIWADFMGIVGGGVFGVAAANFTSTSYFQATRDAIVSRDIYTGLIKIMLFGLVITAVGCKEGFSTGAGAEEVGRSTTAAVVTSIALVVAVDLVFTALFYFINPT
jgi:phospholipid/cholesterol/gamma-HCH transport system permease protein